MSPFDLAGLEEQLAKYRAQMEAPGFWENVENANKVNRAVRPLENKLQTYQKLEGILEDGETLILLHGNGEDSTYFARQISFLEKYFRVLAVDSRGHGSSPRRSPSSDMADP